MRWEKLPVVSWPAWGHLTVAADGTLFYAALSSIGADGVWRSTDFGESWSPAAAGLSDLRPSQPIRALNVEAAYFVGKSTGLSAWQEPAGGQPGSWELRLAAKSEWEGVGHLSLAPDGTLFLNRSDVIRRSTDGGLHWQDLAPLTDGGSIIGFSPLYTVTHTIYGVIDYGRQLRRSTDAGQTWQPLGLGHELDLNMRAAQMIPGAGVTYLFAMGYGDTPSVLFSLDRCGRELGGRRRARTGQEHGDGGCAGWSALVRGARGRDDAEARSDPVAEARPRRGRVADPDRNGDTAAARKPRLAPRRHHCSHPRPDPRPARLTLAPADAALAQRYPELGCPLSDLRPIPMARQRFQRGEMLWLGDDPGVTWAGSVVFVLADGGALAWYADVWQEGLVEPVLAVPAGLQAPVRGFGLVWREQLGGPGAAIGWAAEPECAVRVRRRPGTAAGWCTSGPSSSCCWMRDLALMFRVQPHVFLCVMMGECGQSIPHGAQGGSMKAFRFVAVALVAVLLVGCVPRPLWSG